MTRRPTTSPSISRWATRRRWRPRFRRPRTRPDSEIEDNRIIVNAWNRAAPMPSGRTGFTCASTGRASGDMKDRLARPTGLARRDAGARHQPRRGRRLRHEGDALSRAFPRGARRAGTGRPVHWMSERTEAMLSDNAGRDLDVTCTLGFDADHRLTGLQGRQPVEHRRLQLELRAEHPVLLFSKVLTGTYDVQTVHFRNRGSTPTRSRWTPIAAPAGPRRSMRWNARWTTPRGSWASTRRSCAAELHPADQFPTRSAPASLRCRELPKVLDRAEAGGRRRGLSRRGARLRRRTASCGASGSAITSNPSSARRTRRRRSSSPRPAAKVYVGTQSNGQGHETVYAQLPA
jgi:carbon-monoxide dehydrogenase large subunit